MASAGRTESPEGEAELLLWVNNGCAGRSPDTSAAPRLADDFVRLRKSAEMGQRSG
jgi:hypothetical protein